MTAAAVSSHDVSMPRITGELRRLGIAPHDERVLAVVGVVAPAHAGGDESERLVQVDRGVVGDAHLERVAALDVVAGQLEQLVKQRPGDATASPGRVDSDVHYVPRIDVPGDDQVPEHVLALEGAETDAARLRELAGEHRSRPRRWIGGPLDLLDRVEVGRLQWSQLDGGDHPAAFTARLRSASGARR